MAFYTYFSSTPTDNGEGFPIDLSRIKGCVAVFTSSGLEHESRVFGTYEIGSSISSSISIGSTYISNGLIDPGVKADVLEILEYDTWYSYDVTFKMLLDGYGINYFSHTFQFKTQADPSMCNLTGVINAVGTTTGTIIWNPDKATTPRPNDVETWVSQRLKRLEWNHS